MSLINQALQDLQARQQQSETPFNKALHLEEPLQSSHLSIESTLIHPLQWRVGMWMLLCAVAMAAGFFMASKIYSGHLSDGFRSPSSIVVSSSLPTATNDSATSLEAARISIENHVDPKLPFYVKPDTVIEKPTVGLFTDSENSTYTDSRRVKTTESHSEKILKISMEGDANSVRQTDAIGHLLGLADDAFNKNHLSLPSGSSAYDYYSIVLTTDPANRQAKIGLERIVDRYRNFVNSALAAGDVSSIEKWLRRYKKISGSDAFYLRSKKQLEKVLHASTVLANVVRDGRTSAASGGVRKQIRYSKKTSMQDGRHAAISENISTNSMPADSIMRSWQQQQVNLLNQANALKAEGNWLSLSQLLERELPTYQQVSSALGLILLDSYLQQGRFSDAQSLTENYQFTQWDSHYQLGRIAQAKSGSAVALAYFSHLPENVLRESSTALYAALLQQSGKHQKARNLYQKLLMRDDKSATYWLGFALSSDAINDNNGALAGYLKIQAIPGLSNELLDFVHQRIGKLAQLTKQTSESNL